LKNLAVGAVKKFTGFNNPMAYNEKLKAITIYSSSEM
jgi:hypothetical protein